MRFESWVWGAGPCSCISGPLVESGKGKRFAYRILAPERSSFGGGKTKVSAWTTGTTVRFRKSRIGSMVTKDSRAHKRVGQLPNGHTFKKTSGDGEILGLGNCFVGGNDRRQTRWLYVKLPEKRK